MNKELVKNNEIQTNERLNVLANTIVDEVNLTKSCLALNISAVMVKTYWSVGITLSSSSRTVEKRLNTELQC